MDYLSSAYFWLSYLSLSFRLSQMLFLMRLSIQNILIATPIQGLFMVFYIAFSLRSGYRSQIKYQRRTQVPG